MKNISRILFYFLLLIQLAACDKEEVDPRYPASEFTASGSYSGEYWPTDGWRKCAPGEVGMKASYLEDLNEEVLILKELHVDIHSIIIVKDGYIVAEQYYNDEYGANSLQSIYSCTKSLTSALVGITMEEGFDLELGSRMVDFFPEYDIANMTPEKEAVTLEDMLTMSAGLEWYEIEYPYADERNTFRAWTSSDNWVKFVLDRPMEAPPGTEYSYNTGISQVISAILQRVTGTRTDSLGAASLFDPLGIDYYYWPVDAQNVAWGGNGVRLTPRDMAKFGYLYLKQGVWEGTQVVPSEWVEASQQPSIERKFIPDYYYGYHWWVGNDQTYSAVGYGGQWITIVPEENLVVVFTNGFADGDQFQWSTPERLLHTYILPSLD
jgi:CubicO group peptidase (beta-lactamase class C family)